MTDNPQVVILGGGPAGTVSAILARREGLSVTLISPTRSRPRLEGLSPRLHQWLDHQGLLAGFGGITGPLSRQVDWAGLSESNREFVVERASLDAHLLARAQALGVQHLPSSARIEGREVMAEGGDRLRPEWIIDARGRAAPRPTDSTYPPTIALCGWLRGQVPAPGIRIAALADGWLWRVALPDGRIWSQFVTDAASPDPAPERLLSAVAEAEPMLKVEGLDGDLIAREAAPRLPAPTGDLHCLPVGDALAAMDPLSGHGQFWAVSSALAVAAARRTLRADPEAGTLCRRFLDHRAGETALRMARIGRDFLRSETRFADAPFWATRRNLPDNLPAHPQAPGFSITTAPLIRDGLISEAEVLVTPRSPGGIGWFGKIPAPEVYRNSLNGAEAVARAYGKAAPALLAALKDEATGH